MTDIGDYCAACTGSETFFTGLVEVAADVAAARSGSGTFFIGLGEVAADVATARTDSGTYFIGLVEVAAETCTVARPSLLAGPRPRPGGSLAMARPARRFEGAVQAPRRVADVSPTTECF